MRLPAAGIANCNGGRNQRWKMALDTFADRWPSFGLTEADPFSIFLSLTTSGISRCRHGRHLHFSSRTFNQFCKSASRQHLTWHFGVVQTVCCMQMKVETHGLDPMTLNSAFKQIKSNLHQGDRWRRNDLQVAPLSHIFTKHHVDAKNIHVTSSAIGRCGGVEQLGVGQLCAVCY